jgi:hypothetical protein
VKFLKGERRKITFENVKNRRYSWIGHTIRRDEFVVTILEGAGKTSTSVPKASHQIHRS